MKRQDPSLSGLPLTAEGARAWARALRLHGDVANDNGHGYRRRKGDPPKGTILHLEIAPPKAG